MKHLCAVAASAAALTGTGALTIIDVGADPKFAASAILVNPGGLLSYVP